MIKRELLSRLAEQDIEKLKELIAVRGQTVYDSEEEYYRELESEYYDEDYYDEEYESLEEVNLEESEEFEESNIKSQEEREAHFLDYLIHQGVIYSTTAEDLNNRLTSVGSSLEELELSNERVVENGWLFPAYDSNGNWLYWVNYSHTRDSNKKYLNVMQKDNKDKLVFGLNTLPQALESGRLVWVEGVIDQYRLASYGVPTVATLGTKVSQYMKLLSQRVEENVIIPDNDGDGKNTIGKDFGGYLRHQLSNARIIDLSYVKDIDDCYVEIPEQFYWLVDQLKD